MTIDQSLKHSRNKANRFVGEEIACNSHLTSSELERIKLRANNSSNLHHFDHNKSHVEATRSSHSGSQERKTHMLEKEKSVRARREKMAMEIDIEKERQAPLTDEDVPRHQHLVSICSVRSLAMQAQGYRDCNDLKNRCNERKDKERQYNDTHDQIMAEKKDREAQADKEQRLHKQKIAVEARLELEHQIAERQKKKIWDEELKALEAEKILQTYKKYEKENAARAENKRQQSITLAKQIKSTNQHIEQMKRQQGERERYEELTALAFLKRKEEEQEAQAREERRILETKEAHYLKLCAKERNAHDRRGEQDESRAKKVFESMELAARRKSQEDRALRIETAKSVQIARQEQMEFRQRQKGQENYADMQRARIEEARLSQQADKKSLEEMLRKERNEQYKKDLREQIQSNQHQQQKRKLFDTADAHYNHRKATKDSIVAEKYRQVTLSKLREQNVPEEYLEKLVRLKINKENA